MNFEAASLAYIRYVMADKNMSAGGLAKAAGISASTLTRALNDPKHKFTLSMKTIEKVATFSKINPAPFLEARDSAELITGFFHRQELHTGKDELLFNRIAPRNTIIIGDIAAGKWREPSLVHVVDYGPLSLTSTHHRPDQCFACIVRDESANLIAANGDIIFCVRAKEEKIGEKPWNNWHNARAVVVERRSRDAFKIELSVRFIREEKDHWLLVSANREDHTGEKKHKFFENIKLEKSLGNSELNIIGTVEWVIRGDTTDAANYISFDMP
jgi:hypothetical protein